MSVTPCHCDPGKSRERKKQKLQGQCLKDALTWAPSPSSRKLFFFLSFSAGKQNTMQLKKLEQRIPCPSLGLAPPNTPVLHSLHYCLPTPPPPQGQERPAMPRTVIDFHFFVPLLHLVPLPKTRRNHLLDERS